jgi:hypothetical protein
VGPARAWGEIVAVVALVMAGLLLGAATGYLALGPILGMVLPLVAATLFLRREGRGWRDLGFPRSMPLGLFLWLGVGGAVLLIALSAFAVTPLLRWLGAPPVDASLLVEAIEGDLAAYLVFLIPVGWGSAAFGEELLVRGFLLDRFDKLFGLRIAVVAQALLFALGHAYQGITGMLNLFVVALVLGVITLRAGRNLWPAIAAHGLIDTLSLTLIYLGYAELPAGG